MGVKQATNQRWFAEGVCKGKVQWGLSQEACRATLSEDES